MIDAHHRTVLAILVSVLCASVVAIISLVSTAYAAPTTPSILDSLPLAERAANDTTFDSFSYTVPSGGTNKLLIMILASVTCNPDPTPTATQNGSALTVIKIAGSSHRGCYYVGYLPSPSTGLFSVNFSSETFARYYVMTLQDAAQSSAVDTQAVSNNQSSQMITTNIVTTKSHDLLLSLALTYVEAGPFTAFGGQSTYYNDVSSNGMGWQGGAYMPAGPSAGPESMSATVSATSDFDTDLAVVAIKPARSSPEEACETTSTPPTDYTLQNGTPGNDTVVIAPFTMFVGNGGNDTVLAKNGDFIVCLGSGNDTVTLGKGFAVVAAGGGRNNIMTGGGNKFVTTGNGDDQIATGAGNDVINAGGGKNKVISRGGSDEITTLDGSDFIDGGAGADTCSPGGGANTVLNC